MPTLTSKRVGLKRLIAGSVATLLAIVSITGSYAANSSSVRPPTAAPADPSKVLGNEACVKCHAAEIDVWRRTPHAEIFETLHRKPEAQTIASKLGLQSVKHGGRCVDCHYTTQVDNDNHLHAISGVSCESCHGAARDWVDIHSDYGGPGVTRLTESPAHRQFRIQSAVAAGMRNPTNVFSVAQSCLRCHTTGDEELVNVGGHTAGSLDFEFVSWSQGTIRHNFVRTDGQSNASATPAQRRLMFVAGMIAELEATLRATAKATQKATYGITSAQRSARTIKRLTSVAEKITSSHVDEVLSVAGDIELKLNNHDSLVAAADQIAMIGFEMAATQTGENWTSLDTFIPRAVK